ncbi:hypothetical protein OQA88_11474 [Cercophora sp. LCS_1]
MGGCYANEIDMEQHETGGGNPSCVIPAPKTWGQGPRRGPGGSVGDKHVEPKLCCNRDALKVSFKKFPVPLENLFFKEDLEKLPKDSKPSFAILTDNTMAGHDEEQGTSDPNSSAFAWHIIDGPVSEVANLDKWDGSHWEMWDCDPVHHEGCQTARMVCTDESAESNCHEIWAGEVNNTIIKMPKNCGPGKYAMAVALEPIPHHLPPPNINIRGLGGGQKPSPPTVFELTFNYDFSVLQKRAQKSNSLIRIDYSNNPGHWAEIVAAPPTRKTRRDVEREVAELHGGDMHAYLDHHFYLQQRSISDSELHLLHERWFSIRLDNWIERMRKVELEHTLLQHRIDEMIDTPLIDQTRVCQIGPVTQTLHAKLTVALGIEVETSAQLTIMGNLGDLNSFKQSHLSLRNRGSATVLVNFDAFGRLEFGSMNKELVGIAPVGASINIPGIVTIGPKFKVVSSLQGVMNVHANAQYQVTLANWDYTESYPFNGANPYDEDDLNITRTVSPGLRQGSGQDLSFCYGIDAGYEVFVNEFALTLFPGLPGLNKHWTVAGDEVSCPQDAVNC